MSWGKGFWDKSEEGEIVKFSAEVKRLFFIDGRTGEGKYQVAPFELLEGPRVFKNRKGNTNVHGYVPELIVGNQYVFEGVSKIDEVYGVSYEITSVDMYVPKGDSGKVEFIRRYIGEVSANKIVKKHPDIIDKLINGDKIDISDVKGVGPKRLKKLQDGVQKDMREIQLFKEFDSLLPFRVIKLISEMIYRDEKPMSLGLIKEKLRTKPYHFLCSLSGIGFRTADKMIFLIAKNHPDNKILPKDVMTSDERYKFATNHYMTQKMYETGNTYIEMDAIRNFLKYAVLKITPEKIEELLSDKSVFVVSESEKYIALREYFYKESYIYETVKKAIESKPKGVHIKNLESYQSMPNFDLSEKQLSVIPMLLNHKISVLNGHAGTGKTSTIRKVVEYLNDNDLSYKLMAPTGKAAKVLGETVGEDASTIHLGLGVTRFNDETGHISFKTNAYNPFSEKYIIIDEASMIDTLLMYDLLQGINFERTHLLLIGDDAQLPSVGPGNVFSVLKTSGLPTVELLDVHRYGIGGISTEATKARLGTMDLPFDKYTNGVSGDIYHFEHVDIRTAVMKGIQTYLKLVKEEGGNYDNVLYLSYKRRNTDDAAVEHLNKIIQMEVNEDNDFIQINGEDTRFKINDYVMQTRNDYRAIELDEEEVATLLHGGILPQLFLNDDNTATVINGETGVIFEEFKDGIVVKFGPLEYGREDECKYIYVPNDKISLLELAYVTTIHKSQGSQARNVVIVSPRNHAFAMSSNLIYVAISRTQERCYHYGEADAINTASRKKEQINRLTTLENFFLDKVRIK